MIFEALLLTMFLLGVQASMKILSDRVQTVQKDLIERYEKMGEK